MISVRTLVVSLALAAGFGVAPLAASAQAPVTQTATSTQTATITAIDYTQRVVSLQFTDGTTKTVEVGPDVKRFSQLKVGDTVTFTATESVVYSIVKPGAAAPPADSSAMTSSEGTKPGGTATATKTTVVTVTAIDQSVPSITVKTADGKVLSFKVKDPKNIAGVKVGDQVQITYNVSVIISVK